ncbi:MAG: formate/nitrite transporter family protein [Verrucomicrobiia bacterium]
MSTRSRPPDQRAPPGSASTPAQEDSTTEHMHLEAQGDRALRGTHIVWTRVFYGRAVMQQILETIGTKDELRRRYRLRYVLRAAMAGVIIMLMYLFAYQVKTDLGTGVSPGFAQFLMAGSFSFALVLIYYTNSELLTSNFMYFTVGRYYGAIRRKETLTILTLCLVGNFLGLAAAGLLMRSASMISPSVLDTLVHTVHAKTVTSSIWTIFVKAIFANYFINISVIIAMQVKENLAKMVVLIAGVTVFAYMGYEHVVANAGLFVLAGLFDPSAVSFAHMGKNLFFSLLGNYVGGGLVIGLFYAYLNDERQGASATEPS